MKSQIAVPAILVDVKTNQYTIGSYLFIDNLMVNNPAKIAKNIKDAVAYPRLNVIENMSAPVSPNVVDAILITQYDKMMMGTRFRMGFDTVILLLMVTIIR